MRTEELAEVFLAHLYNLAEAAPHPNFLFMVNDFASTVGIEDGKELQKAVDYLGDRGLVVSAVLDTWGGISAAITMEGSIFVEEGGETGIIARFRQDPEAFRRDLRAGPAQTPAAPPREAEIDSFPVREAGRPRGRAVGAILADIEEALEQDAAMASEGGRDAIANLAALKIQMGRNVKNSRVIEALLDDLGSVPSISPLIAGLRCIIGASQTDASR
jgi:hypothetical protein